MIGQPVWMMEEKAKERGKARAESANYRDVQIARQIAKEAFLCGGLPVSADDVRRVMTRRFPDTAYGNWLGSCFRGNEWEPVGWVQSTHKGGHRRAIRTWRLK